MQPHALIRDLDARDVEPLRDFFDSISTADLALFKEDVRSAQVLERWMSSEEGVRLVAVMGPRGEPSITGVAAVWLGVGRSRHVGELHLFVSGEHRGQGVGRQLARRSLVKALEHGIRKITVEAVSREQQTVDMFLSMGYVPEALLVDQLRETQQGQGPGEDVVVLSYFADDVGRDLQLVHGESQAE